MTKTDVVVIGGGAVGLCCAWYLRQAGREVTVVEAGTIGVGASAGNAGMIVPSHIVPLSAPGVIAQGLRWLLNPSSTRPLKRNPTSLC
ncbi:MAG: FAD-dependent oxidoreductase [Myxococcota bacterium]